MQLGKKRAIHLMLLILGGFILLTVFIHLFPSSWIDREFSEEIQEDQNPFLDMLMKGISWFGQTWISIGMVLLLSLLLLIQRLKKEALFMLLTLVNGLITYSLKVLVNRPRPTQNMVHIVEMAKHQSFPSGHTSFYIVFFGFIAFLLYHHKWFNAAIRNVLISFCMFLIFSIPISRIYLGAHWFTDVLGGFMIGLLCLMLIIGFYLRPSKNANSSVYPL
ncbi:MAG: hypothetical protein JWN56_847 [Sphingobacteriales bacterium]|nr:hypothetical protein [Sphingobacteriales bacterium]